MHWIGLADTVYFKQIVKNIDQNTKAYSFYSVEYRSFSKIYHTLELKEIFLSTKILT